MQQTKCSSELGPHFHILTPLIVADILLPATRSAGFWNANIKRAQENSAYHFWLCLNGCRYVQCLWVGRIWTSFWISCHSAVLTWWRATNPAMSAFVTPMWWLHSRVPLLTLMGKSSQAASQKGGKGPRLALDGLILSFSPSMIGCPLEGLVHGCRGRWIGSNNNLRLIIEHISLMWH